MNKLITITIATIAMMSCTTQQKVEQKQTLAQQLEERMNSLQKKGYMAGHQDDPFYGIGWAYEDGKSDVKLTVGDYPAVMGFDLGGIEMGDDKNLDSVPFTRIHDELLAHVKRGGIVTISWHPRNPLTTAPDGGRGEQKTEVPCRLCLGRQRHHYREKHSAWWTESRALPDMDAARGQFSRITER